MKTFVTVGETQYGESRNILYAGKSESKARSFNVGMRYVVLTIEVWVGGKLYQTYSKTSAHDWELNYDKLEKITGELLKKKQEVDELEGEVNELKSFLKS